MLYWLIFIKVLIYLHSSGVTSMYLLDLVKSKKYFTQNLYHLWFAFIKS